MGARERVRRVLAAAARIGDEGDPLYREALARLPQETGLAPDSIALALSLSLERSATDRELTSLLASVPPERRVHVVLSGNVFVAPVRAIALAWASAPDLQVRPSRRCRVIPELLCRALDEAGGEGTLTLVDAEGERTAGNEGPRALVDALAVAPGECVHAYGSDATLEALRAALPAGARLWGHGHGVGVAVLEEATMDAALPGLALDITLFAQQGCLSPRLALFVGSEAAGERLAHRLHGLLAGELSTVDNPFKLPPLPFRERGAGGGEVSPLNNPFKLPLSVQERGPGGEALTPARRHYLAAMEAAGFALEGPTVVGFQSEPEGLVLPPEPGILPIAQVSSVERAAALLAPWGRWITCLGGEGSAADHLAAILPRARRAAPGWMQRPPLDGPVDRRTLPPRAALGRGCSVVDF